MADFNFDMLGTSKVEWPKRGRKPKPLPEKLVKALHDSFVNESIPNIILPNDQVDSFGNLLSAAGRKLNMRIERHIEIDSPKEGFSTFHFRARAKRNKDFADD